MLRAGGFCKDSSLLELKKPESEWAGEESESDSTIEERFKSRTIYSSRCCTEESMTDLVSMSTVYTVS